MITGGHTGYVWMETRDKGQASEALCTNTLYMYNVSGKTHAFRADLF